MTFVDWFKICLIVKGFFWVVGVLALSKNCCFMLLEWFSTQVYLYYWYWAISFYGYSTIGCELNWVAENVSCFYLFSFLFPPPPSFLVSFFSGEGEGGWMLLSMSEHIRLYLCVLYVCTCLDWWIWNAWTRFVLEIAL